VFSISADEFIHRLEREIIQIIYGIGSRWLAYNRRHTIGLEAGFVRPIIGFGGALQPGISGLLLVMDFLVTDVGLGLGTLPLSHG
jgi:hypothetical protein